MRRWLREQLDSVIGGQQEGALIVLDPEGVLDESDTDDLAERLTVRQVADWADLRVLWDLEVRRRGDSAAVIIRSPDFAAASDLPWDIEHEATTVVRLRWPVPPELRQVLKDAPDLSERLVQAAKDHSAVGDILGEALGFQPGDPAGELGVIARLRTDPATPQALWDSLSAHLHTALAQRTAARRGDVGAIQEAWSDWITHGDEAAFARELEAAPGPLAALFASGLLTPGHVAVTGLPSWTAVGSAEPDPARLLTELVAQRPPPASTLTEWIDTASWWGGVRGTAAGLPTQPHEASVWNIWDRLNSDFGDWLRRFYGSSLLASAPTPRGVHQVAPFLARRVHDGARVVLIVIDGLGFAQWARLRAAGQINVVESTGCLAMIPTLTSISRQAILAGSLPIYFADTLATTSAEPRRWATFWAEHGLSERDATYVKVLGATPAEVPPLAGMAAAIVVGAVDRILHGASVLGDQQVNASVEIWARAGFLSRLVERANSQGYEVWITSDHGNIPTIPGTVPSEGDTLESAGTRVRLYPNATLRGIAREHGEIWDPPGVPSDRLHPLFATGRRGYHSRPPRVSHGGISLDEVIVPFARVGT